MTLFDSPSSPPPSSRKSAQRVIHMQFDGGSRGNPGPAGIGVTLTDEKGNRLYDLGEYLGECTNNVAEYTALVRGVEAAIALHAAKLLIKADSELVVRQLNAQYKVRSPDLRPLFLRATTLMRQIPDVHVTHVYRESNSRADALANAAMDRKAKIEPLGSLPDVASKTK